jgi:hypothetical protein
VVLANHGNGLRAIGSVHDVEPLALEVETQHSGLVGVVLGDHHTLRHGAFSPKIGRRTPREPRGSRGVRRVPTR